jgi:hypothetical protein
MSEIALGKTYSNLDEFYSAFKQYCDRTFQVFVKRSSLTDADPKIKYKSITFKCVHHRDKNNIKSKGRGVRCTQRYNAASCKATVHVNMIQLFIVYY